MLYFSGPTVLVLLDSYGGILSWLLLIVFLCCVWLSEIGKVEILGAHTWACLGCVVCFVPLFLLISLYFEGYGSCVLHWE